MRALFSNPGKGALAALSCALLPACGGTPPKRPVLPADDTIGLCAEPNRGGRVSDTPRMRRADRDLNGDGRAERIAADRNLCSAEGNCYWNLYALAPNGGGAERCWRHVGTVFANALSQLRSRGEDGFYDLRGFWTLGGDRFLLHEYRFARGGYQMEDTLLCRQAGDDRVQCATERRVGP